MDFRIGVKEGADGVDTGSPRFDVVMKVVDEER
jgi:hypothetical protein